MNFKGTISSVTLGRLDKRLELGGHATLPFIKPYITPKVALMISDSHLEFPKGVYDCYRQKANNILEIAEYYVATIGVDALYLQLTHELTATNILLELIDAVSVPIIISGSGEKERDAHILKRCAEEAEGENLLLYKAELDDYKTLAANALIYGHTLVAESPIDVNIAKQLNIILTDFGLPLERIVIDPMVASLGYGLEYTYSVVERIRLQALAGDKMLSSPMIGFVNDSWKSRESSVDHPLWGPIEERGILWEAVTASTLFSSGIDLLVFKHPESVTLFKQTLGGDKF